MSPVPRSHHDVPALILARRQEIGAGIAELRTLRGWSQQYLAKLAGITQSSLSRLEKGDNIDLTTAIRVALVLGMDFAMTPTTAPGEDSPLPAVPPEGWTFGEPGATQPLKWAYAGFHRGYHHFRAELTVEPGTKYQFTAGKVTGNVATQVLLAAEAADDPA